MLILDKMARHNSFIIWLLCSPKNPAYDWRYWIDAFDTQGTLHEILS